jgi:hypothetical protein
LNIILIDDYARLLLPTATTGNQALNFSDWTLGQVIAVAVWAPVLLEYIWIWIVGPEEGFKYRLSKANQVRRTDSGQGAVELVPQREEDVLEGSQHLKSPDPAAFEARPTRHGFRRIDTDPGWEEQRY